MQQIVITGNVGKDAELRTTQGGDSVLSFNVGVKQGYGENASTNWFRCSLWGKRADSLKLYLLKGVKVAVSGEFSTNEYEGKTQLNVRVGEVDLMSRAENNGQRQAEKPAAQTTWDDDLDSDIPF